MADEARSPQPSGVGRFTPQQKWFLHPFSVPLQKEPMDPTTIQAAAAATVSRQPRSFEVFWNGSELELCFGASTSWDLDLTMELYRQHIKVGQAAGGDGGGGSDADATTIVAAPAEDGNACYPAPGWLPRLDPSRTSFFFVGNELGHCFAVFDTRRTGMLMTPLLTTLQRSRFAWVQFEWFEADLRGQLSDLKSAMLLRWKDIDTPIMKTFERTDSAGRPHMVTEKRDHPAKHGEFHSSQGMLKAHIESKMGSRLAAMIVRGLVDLGQEGGVDELPFNIIEDTGEVRPRRELRPWQVQAPSGEAKVGERLKAWWSHDPRILLDLVRRRAFDVDRPMRAYVKDYLPWRRSLPFVLLGSEEMGLLVHPPSSDVNGLKTTRRSELPPPSPNGRAEKRGIQIAGAY